MQHIPWIGKKGGTCRKATAMHAMQCNWPGERGEEASDGAESPPGHLLAGCWPSSRHDR